MQTLSQHISNQFENVLNKSNIYVVSDPISIHSRDTNFILLSDYEQIGTLIVQPIEKKIKIKKTGLSIRLEINFGQAKRTFSMDYFPDENGPMLFSLFSTLEKEMKIWENKTPL